MRLAPTVRAVGAVNVYGVFPEVWAVRHAFTSGHRYTGPLYRWATGFGKAAWRCRQAQTVGLATSQRCAISAIPTS